MKKICAALLLFCVLLAGCADSAPPAGPSDGSPLQEEAVPEEVLQMEIDPRNEYENYGYTHFAVEENCTYRLKAEHAEGLEWSVYLLDEEFTDAERYIPHTASAVFEGTGNIDTEIEAAAGSWVYLYCSANSWTCIEVPEGARLKVYQK